MTSQTDIRRARFAVRQELEDLDALKQTLDACSDQQLRRVLGCINRRRAVNATRLLNWLRERSPECQGYSRAQQDQAPVVESEGLADADVEAGMSVSAHPSGPATGAAASDAGYQVEVVERRDVAANLLAFKVPRPIDFSFMPGQSVKLRLDGIRRSYSIVSAPHEAVVEFFVELVPDGQMSEQLGKLPEGGILMLEARPKGNLTLDERFPTHLMVATVTGVNPFVSILREYLHQGRRGHRFYILHGASYQDEFGYRDELERMATTHPDVLTYIPSVSRPDEPRNVGWTGERGRVDVIVDKYLSQFGLDNRSTVIYACGNPGMVDEVERRYRPQGFEIKTERYD